MVVRFSAATWQNGCAEVQGSKDTESTGESIYQKADHLIQVMQGKK